MRPMSPPFASWTVVAVALIVAETLAVYVLRGMRLQTCLGAVCVVGVLAVSIVWWLALRVLTAVLNAAALGFLYTAPTSYLVASYPRGPVALTIVLAVAVLLCALPGRSGRVGRPLTPSAAAIELEVVAGEGQRAAFALRDGGTVLPPADLPQLPERCVREPVMASVGAFLPWLVIARGWGSAVER
jgi:hypothetical protein